MNRPFRAIALMGALALALPAACTAQQPQSASDPAKAVTPQSPRPLVTGLPDFTELVTRVGPAVVNISAQVSPRASAQAQGQLPDGAEELFRRFFGPGAPMPGAPAPGAPQGPRGGVSQGTGFLISSDGYLLTNRHVIDGADQVNVKLSDGRELPAEVVGSDEHYDVALLKIDATGLPWLRHGSSERLKAGQWVVAIGSPFGLDHSVTAGIVSAVGRSNPYAGQQYVPFIQTDVAINRGNSGGPLLDTSGEVVGINSQIFSNSGGYMGVSFAIPIDLAMNAVQQLKETGRVSRGQLGVQVSGIDSEFAKALRLPDTRGALVAVVAPGSAADKAGVQRMDVIRAFNGNPVNDSSDLPPLVGTTAPGTQATVTVFRGGKELKLPVVVDELAGEPARAAAAPTRGGQQGAPAQQAAPNVLGVVPRELSAAERQRLGLDRGEGVLVAQVAGGGAREAGLRQGDVILAIGRNTVGNPAELSRELSSVRPGDTVMVLVRRGGNTQYVAVTAQQGG
ncbi:MAG: trypsin-like peptidase domain-containing protein [Pseudomonadota bacterium]|nr:trypsin-like peptidase domain-containing protein [Pseudomonadota bacterium]